MAGARPVLRPGPGARGRGIAGLSEGGYGALNIGLHHPGEFTLVQSWSGYMRADHIPAVFGHSMRLMNYNSPAKWVSTVAPQLRADHAISGSTSEPRIRWRRRTAPAVGALFTITGTGLGKHFCTASVIDSPHRDLVLTAAHCVTRIKPARMAFVPGYHGGKAPYGVWAVTRVILDSRWISSAAPDDDFAFLVVRSPTKAPVEEITGGERLGIGQPPGRMVRVVGYPDGVSAPIVCSNRARQYNPEQVEFDCGGYADGTSGSPLLAEVDPATGLGTVLGVIGGYEQGGYTSDVSYAARFAASAAALYKIAISES